MDIIRSINSACFLHRMFRTLLINAYLFSRHLSGGNCTKHGGWYPSSFPFNKYYFSNRSKNLCVLTTNWSFSVYCLSYPCLVLYLNRVMAELSSLLLQLTHVLVMAMLWLHVLGYPFRSVFWTKSNWLSYFSRWYGYIYLLNLQDLEFVQFHPTGIYGAGCLITEGFT